MSRIWSVALDALPKILAAGVRYTIPLTVSSFALGLALAVLVALVRTAPGNGLARMAQVLCRGYVWVFRGTPLMVQLFIAFYGLPHAGIKWSAIACAIIVLSLNVGAYASETVRGAIESVPSGQYEASLSIGLGHWQTMRHVILPQAMRASVPALSNTLISLVKDTSLVASITVAEMLMTTQRAVATTYEPLILYTEVALIYLLICTALSLGQRRLEKTIESKGTGTRPSQMTNKEGQTK